ncbi:MAG: NADH-ubiquinone oxidoreductase-F iron-sulfur binding region domain-containing protein [Candidatus Heimdallarchaeaceae archaeon]
MSKVKEFQDFIQESIKIVREKHHKNRIIVGYGTCGIAAGAEEVYMEIKNALKELGKEDILVEKTGCIGCCSHEPLVDIELEGEPRVSYRKVSSENVAEILKNHFNGTYLSENIFGVFFTQPNLLLPEETWEVEVESSFKQFTSFYDLPLLKTQKRITLRNVGLINPEKIEDYLAKGGYQALIKVLTSMSPKEAIEEVKKSQLRGRGGAGFPTGLKWEFAHNAKSDQKYVIANADEGDPGAFMDRALIEGDPHSLIEGLTISAFATGASKGFVYIRAEYPLAVERLEKAIKQAEKHELLGENILGTSFSFTLEIRQGAGAFVCGEETALMNSIMGKRGEPRPRPPYPAIEGLWGKPTTINNVKTLSTIPPIILKGGEWFSQIGTEDTSGTAVFALTGDVVNSGLVEVPMGTTLREIIFDIGGGIKEEREFKAVQTGGPSGGCIPASHIDTPIDFGSLKELGSIMGSGGMIVCSDTTCMVDLARYFLHFTASESCGKCTPCREGTIRALEILERITRGEADKQDLNDLEALANVIKDTSLCGLGQTAPNPVLSTLRYFREEYLEHVEEHKCRAHVCPELFRYEIDDNICITCGICQKVCSVNAVMGTKETEFHIESRLCVRCNMCYEQCPVNAIRKVEGK